MEALKHYYSITHANELIIRGVEASSKYHQGEGKRGRLNYLFDKEILRLFASYNPWMTASWQHNRGNKS
jgi:hypothetical protein